MAVKKTAKVLRFLDSVGDWSGKIVAPIVAIMTAILAYEMTMRYLFNSPTVWVHETSQYLFAAYAFIAGAYAFRVGMHVNMDIVYRLFPRRIKAATDLFTSLVGLFYILALIWFGGLEAWDSIGARETSTTVWAPPIYPFRAIIPIAAFLMLLQWLAQFIRNVIISLTGKEPL